MFGHERVIYLGNGEWKPLANTSHPGEAAESVQARSGGRGRADQLVDAARCHPWQLPFAEIPQSQAGQDFALE